MLTPLMPFVILQSTGGVSPDVTAGIVFSAIGLLIVGLFIAFIKGYDEKIKASALVVKELRDLIDKKEGESFNRDNAIHKRIDELENCLEEEKEKRRIAVAERERQVSEMDRRIYEIKLEQYKTNSEQGSALAIVKEQILNMTNHAKKK